MAGHDCIKGFRKKFRWDNRLIHHHSFSFNFHVPGASGTTLPHPLLYRTCAFRAVQFKNITGDMVAGTVPGRKILLVSENWMRMRNCDPGGSGADGYTRISKDS